MNNIFEQEKRWLLEEKYEGEKGEAFFADVKKLKAGIPLAYLIGNMPFLNCKIDLEYKPLIPRPETEFWVNNFIEKELKTSKIKNCKVEPCTNDNITTDSRKIEILDLFSGSGCIGIGILKNNEVLPHCLVEIDFGEKNQNFIKQIKKNLKLNLTKNIIYNKTKIFQTDIFSNIPKNKKYDYILTNPPYISENKKDTVQKSVLNYEDHSSLFAEDEGLFFIKKIIENGFNFLKPRGKVYIEFDPWQKEILTNYLQEKKIKFKFQKDQYEKYRVLILFT